MKNIVITFSSLLTACLFTSNTTMAAPKLNIIISPNEKKIMYPNHKRPTLRERPNGQSCEFPVLLSYTHKRSSYCEVCA